MELAREQVLDSLLLGLESTNTRMIRLADAMLTHGKPVPYKQSVSRIKALRPDDVRAVARKYLRGRPFAAAFIGPGGVDLGPIRRFR
jgi:predicted Zn-dependent peptidase